MAYGSDINVTLLLQTSQRLQRYNCFAGSRWSINNYTATVA
ncbi:hypothetical protein [Sulfolobus spindle-shaped virus]|nr:hypothetical protein [Sulfolobus spindle-shaped virus]AZG03109.1 hypothetical protein [Sulfolobus spindle-shaped virus]AZG03387.1 hypothetical protein [Sulfolobus spindle-shaped virus]